MVLCEEGECSVCLLTYTRSERIPRLLHCRHAFCQPCLETMSQTQGSLLTVGCPLCRRITCISRGLGLQEALWVDSRLWQQIPEEEEEKEDELEVQHEEEVRMKGEDGRKEKTQRGVKCASGCTRGTRLRLPAFLRRFRMSKQQQQQQRDMIVPGSSSNSVEMKSWRRLSTDEMF